MTAAASAAHLLAILDRLPSVAKPRTDKDVLLAEAAAAIRDLLAELDAEAELDGVLDRVGEHAQAQCPEHGILCKGAGCCCADLHKDVPRPDSSAWLTGQGDPEARPSAPGHPHLPPPAVIGEEVHCLAKSPDGWVCTARLDHPEMWHAPHDRGGQPFAGFAWPVAGVPDGVEVGDRDDITEHEYLDALNYVVGKYGKVPPSLMRVLDMGGRFKRSPADVPRPEVVAGEKRPENGPGHLNGHAADPFRVSGICGGDTA